MNKEQLERLAAAMLITYATAEQIARVVSRELNKLGLDYHREEKRAINSAKDSVIKFYKNISVLSDWAVSLGKCDTSSGHTSPVKVFDAIQQESNELARLVCLWSNATNKQEDNVFKIECILRNMSNNILYDEDTINQFKTKEQI